MHEIRKRSDLLYGVVIWVVIYLLYVVICCYMGIKACAWRLWLKTLCLQVSLVFLVWCEMEALEAQQAPIHDAEGNQAAAEHDPNTVSADTLRTIFHEAVQGKDLSFISLGEVRRQVAVNSYSFRRCG